jgi:hypothetical protein
VDASRAYAPCVSRLAAPLAFGESRFEGVRIGFVFPLGVHFEVLDDVQTVIVYDVGRIDVEWP